MNVVVEEKSVGKDSLQVRVGDCLSPVQSSRDYVHKFPLSPNFDVYALAVAELYICHDFTYLNYIYLRRWETLAPKFVVPETDKLRAQPLDDPRLLDRICDTTIDDQLKDISTTSTLPFPPPLRTPDEIPPRPPHFLQHQFHFFDKSICPSISLRPFCSEN
jgi:hypothetical protein